MPGRCVQTATNRPTSDQDTRTETAAERNFRTGSVLGTGRGPAPKRRSAEKKSPGEERTIGYDDSSVGTREV